MDTQSNKIKLQNLISLLIIFFGFLLLVLNITFESEPGAVPLFIVIVGTGYYLYIKKRGNMLSELSTIIKKPISILQYALSTALLSALLLIIPLTAKIISDEMKWSIFDFFAAWSLIFTASFTYRLASKNVNNITYKAAIALSVFSGLFLIWSNLAVGLIGNENNPINWVYPGVLAIGTLGAIVTRLQPRGMAIVLFIMAFSHLIISALALIAGMQYAPESSVTEILAVNGFFAFLWTASGLLFLNTVKEDANSKV